MLEKEILSVNARITSAKMSDMSTEWNRVCFVRGHTSALGWGQGNKHELERKARTLRRVSGQLKPSFGKKLFLFDWFLSLFVYWFPAIAVTNYHKSSGLKQHEFVIL